jgi:lipocalin
VLINKTLRRRRTADFKLHAKLRTAIFERCFLHEQKPKMIEVAGKAIMVDSSQWSERRTSTVSMRVGYGEKDDMPQKLKGLYKGLTHDATLQNMFTPQNR